jgi:hypothetical protein
MVVAIPRPLLFQDEQLAFEFFDVQEKLLQGRQWLIQGWQMNPNYHEEFLWRIKKRVRKI